LVQYPIYATDIYSITFHTTSMMLTMWIFNPLGQTLKSICVP